MSEKTMEQAMADTATPKVPRGSYRVKIIEAEFKLSREKKTPYFDFKCELSGNPPVMIDGQQVDVNGITGNKSFWLTPKTLNRLGVLHKQLGLPLTFTLAEILEKPNTTMYIGGKFLADCRTTPKPQRQENGKPLIGSDGQQVVYSAFEIGDAI